MDICVFVCMWLCACVFMCECVYVLLLVYKGNFEFVCVDLRMCVFSNVDKKCQRICVSLRICFKFCKIS